MKSKIKTYCDNAISPKWLIRLSKKGLVELCYVPYENRTKRLRQVEPSLVEYNQAGFTYNEPNVTYDSFPSNKLELIQKIVGKDKDFDIRHLDAAYKNKCECFITSDKGDLIANGKREMLEDLLSIKIFHQHEENLFKQFYKLKD